MNKTEINFRFLQLQLQVSRNQNFFNNICIWIFIANGTVVCDTKHSNDNCPHEITQLICKNYRLILSNTYMRQQRSPLSLPAVMQYRWIFWLIIHKQHWNPSHQVGIQWAWEEALLFMTTQIQRQAKVLVALPYGGSK